MIWLLRIMFLGIFISMLVVVTWASLAESILKIPTIVQNDVWFIATLFDAYFGFTTFFAWLCYRDKGSFLYKAFWLILIYGLGNLAMSFYMLLLLFKLPSNAPLSAVWTRKDA